MSNNPLTHHQIELSNLLISNLDNINTFNQLLLNGADINAQNNLGWSVLFELITSHKNKTLSNIINKGANINIRDNKGRNALFWSIFSNNIEATNILISLGIELEVIENLHVMHYASYKGNIELFKLLLKNNLNVNQKDILDSTPLIHAVYHNKIKVIDLLLKNGANIEHTDNMGNCAISLAKQLKVKKMIKKLKDNSCLK